MTAPRLPAFDLSGRVALVTGAAGLLGREHCIALAECGAKVVLTDLNTAVAQAADRLRDETGRDVFTGLTMDVTDPGSIRAACDSVVSHHGGVHILINNAAIDPKVKPDGGLREASRLENFPLEDWRLQVDVGLTGAFLCSQVFGTWMAQHGGGAILNIASDLSVIAPDQRLYRKPGLPEDRQPVKPVTYSVIKTALIGLTRYLAAYWAQDDVRVNALSPGGVYADQPEEFVQRLAALIPMRRMAARDEYRAAVQFLCSDASRYLTGQNIVMDGGRSVL
jgi:NAD(P)-dependent dehydrogenase (short-subunit alcohol dehydrogenase family)